MGESLPPDPMSAAVTRADLPAEPPVLAYLQTLNEAQRTGALPC